MIYSAKHRFADTGARKMRPFAQMVRGKSADEAIEYLRFLPNRGARLIEAVIKSAVGNAEDHGCSDVDSLVVTVCRIDEGPTYKRIQPRARGTAFAIKRRLAHIIVTLTDMEAFQAQLASQQVTPQTPTPAPAATTPPAQTTVPTTTSSEPQQQPTGA